MGPGLSLGEANPASLQQELEQPGRILVVDDNRLSRLMLSQFLQDLGHQVEMAVSGQEALDRLQREAFDLLLLDVNMPGMSGEDVLHRIRDTPLFHRLPVVVVSASSGLEVVVRCIQAGAEDFLTKPFEKTLLRTRIEALLEKKWLRDAEGRRRMELEQLRQELERNNQALQETNATLEAMAFTDILTELPNRRYAMQTLQRAFDTFLRYKRPFSVILLDVDHFKQFNDRYGHECGDQVLIEMGRVGRRSGRDCDVFCRFGGEEFLLFCPETEAEGAAVVAERFRQALSQLVIEFEGQKLCITASFGVAAIGAGHSRLNALLQSADRALYQAKAQGRNRVVIDCGSSHGEVHGS